MIVTDEIGCHPDVVVDPAVGDVVPAGDQAALATAISSRLAEPADSRRLADAWRSVRDSFRYDVLASKLVVRLSNVEPSRGGAAA